MSNIFPLCFITNILQLETYFLTLLLARDCVYASAHASPAQQDNNQLINYKQFIF